MVRERRLGTSGDPDAKTEVYAPATDSWGTAADNPTPLAGPGSAVVGDKLYVVGGCTTGSCGSTAVEVYDPASDTWSSAAAYPESIAWESCGNIAGKLYCAGGATGDTTVSHGYVYDPSADAWNPIADLPTDLWGSAYAGANGQLLVVGGVTNDTEVTNQGFAYNPMTDAWSSLPNANTATYRGGSALGFYTVGGNPGGMSAPPVATVEVLPGFDQIGTSDVSWLSEDSTTFTLAPGQTQTVKVTLDAGVPEITQPGTFTAAITIVTTTTTPYATPSIPVSFTVNPPASWGKLSGIVSAKAADGSVVPLGGATVEIDSPISQHTMKTAADGSFALWLEATNHPLTLIVAKDGYRPQTRVVAIAAGKRTTANFTLVKP